jgi:hypothetical protein
MNRKLANRAIMLLTVIASAIIPVCFNDAFAAQKAATHKKPPPAKPAARVIQLRDIDQLREAFQGDAGKVRLVMILSPT